MEDLRGTTLKEFSKQTQDILLSSLSKGTTTSYNVYLNTWQEYCKENKIPSHQITIQHGIDFLTYLFHEKQYGYSAMNNARSALSLVIPTNNLTFGKQDIVVRFMRGIFRLRPSLPKYTVTYDPQIVMDYLSTITNMDLKALTFKLTTLLCFLTGQRNQTINSIDMSPACMEDNEDEDKITFFVPTILKTTKPSSHLVGGIP